MRWLLPWVAARHLYGRYTAFRQGEFGAEGHIDVGSGVSIRVELDPLLRILVPIRLWCGLGVIVVLVKLIADPDLNQTIQDVFRHGVITMVLGPFGVGLGALAIVVLAGRGQRATAARGLVRPVVIAAVTVLMSVSVFGLQLPGVRQTTQELLEQGQSFVPAALAWVLGLVLG